MKMKMKKRMTLCGEDEVKVMEVSEVIAQECKRWQLAILDVEQGIVLPKSCQASADGWVFLGLALKGGMRLDFDWCCLKPSCQNRWLEGRHDDNIGYS